MAELFLAKKHRFSSLRYTSPVQLPILDLLAKPNPDLRAGFCYTPLPPRAASLFRVCVGRFDILYTSIHIYMKYITQDICRDLPRRFYVFFPIDSDIGSVIGQAGA